MIPARYSHILFGLILSFLMTGVVSAIVTVRALPPEIPFLGAWFGSWMSSWAIGFPVVLFVAPITRRLVAKLTK
ncbi:Protein of unknown function [Octadecabacter temperatus]|jgi:hypothetical protein|uniref:Uncharacterized protein n=1 Tax=Octadecabacter temperatus TaxID=1458307 RepID=A0A0K0Y6V9_9RHOB|nr:DUF2798 domain-containing protein [Octadecabacter temperatus]AKS46587.1 hypothetical protein OSB_20480 [Octadecabacter temperatus]SIO17201.1 Protein of unknown function [Octadecabacter temperatus]